MAIIDWKESFSVGVAELDEQHKGLLDIINDLSEVKRHHSDTKVLYETLNDLIRYAQNHFTTEERLLAERGYIGLAEQQKEHDAFTEKIFLLNEALAKGDSGIFIKIMDFVKDWYISHIFGLDQGYKSVFVNKSDS